MKNLKFLLLFALGLLLSVGSLQAQAKKSCNQPCTKMSTAQASDLNATASAMSVSQTATKQTVKNCDPKNCNPQNCKVKNCPPGCDISKCLKGKKSTSSSFMKVSDSSSASAKPGKPIALY